MLEGFNADDVSYAVFDDIYGGFKNFPEYKAWLGAQKTIIVTDKYKKKVRVKWGKPAIYVCQVDPRLTEGRNCDLQWLEGNCDFIEIKNNLVTFPDTNEPESLVTMPSYPESLIDIGENLEDSFTESFTLA